MRKCKKYSTAIQAIDDNMEHAHCMLYDKATKKNLEYVILFFHCNKGYKNAPQCYVIRTLALLFHIKTSDTCGSQCE
jgi:hypothetical protein